MNLTPSLPKDFQFRDMNEKDTKCEPESWNPVANILEVINDEFEAYVGNVFSFFYFAVKILCLNFCLGFSQ